MRDLIFVEHFSQARWVGTAIKVVPVCLPTMVLNRDKEANLTFEYFLAGLVCADDYLLFGGGASSRLNEGMKRVTNGRERTALHTSRGSSWQNMPRRCVFVNDSIMFKKELISRAYTLRVPIHYYLE